MDECHWEYIGDGLYVGFDNHGYWLHANSHSEPTDRIYLEPEVFDALVKYREKWHQMEKGLF